MTERYATDDMLDALLRATDCERVADLSQEMMAAGLDHTHAETLLALTSAAAELIASSPDPDGTFVMMIRFVQRFIDARSRRRWDA